MQSMGRWQIVFLGTLPRLAALAVAEYQFCYLEVYMKHWPISRVKKACSILCFS